MDSSQFDFLAGHYSPSPLPLRRLDFDFLQRSRSRDRTGAIIGFASPDSDERRKRLSVQIANVDGFVLSL